MTADAPSNPARAMVERARRDPGGVAYRSERLGIWHEVTWAEVRERVERSTAVLLELGLEAGETVVFIVPPTPDWFCLDLAAQAIGAVPLALYESFPDEAVAELLNEHGPRILVVQEAEAFERVGRTRDLPTIEHVVVVNSRTAGSTTAHEAQQGVIVHALDQLTSPAEPDPHVADLVERGGPGAGVLSLTAGTTGPPNAAAWTAAQLDRAAQRWVDGAFTLAGHEPPSPHDRVVAELPVAHIAGRLLLGVLPTTHGIVVHYPERAGGSLSSSRAVAPTLAVAPARSWQLVAEAMDRAVSSSGRVRRWLVRRVQRSRRRSRARGVEPSGPARRQIDLLYRWCVVRPAMRKIGFSSLRSAQVVEGPLPGSLRDTWRSWGIELAECYSTAEHGVVAIGHARSGSEEDDRWLQLCPDVRAMTSAEGELHLRADDPTGAASRAASRADGEIETSEDGWEPTGDVGLVDDSRIRILGPASPALRLPAGEFLPAFDVERVIGESRYVRTANTYVSAERASAIVEPSIGLLRDDLGPRAVVAPTRGELLTDPVITDRLRSELAAANARLARLGLPVIERFIVLTRELDPVAGDPVTPTRKVRRAQAAALETEGLKLEFGNGHVPADPGGSDSKRLAAGENVENREVTA